MSLHSSRHGGEVYSIARNLGVQPDTLLDFSSNANIFAFDLTKQLIESTPYPFVHYPDSTAHILVQEISAHEQVPASSILAGNGSADLIWHIFQQLRPGRVVFIGPIFSEFVTACRAQDISFSIIPTRPEDSFNITPEHCRELAAAEADLVVLCTPNNPACITYPGIKDIVSSIRAPRLLIDNSYREFLAGMPAYAENHYTKYKQYAAPGVSVFTLHSFTKFFCCPGIRLGYLLGPADDIAFLQSKRPSWMIPAFAQQVGAKLLQKIACYQDTLLPLREAVSETARELHTLKQVIPETVFEGPGFLIFQVRPPLTAKETVQHLLRHHVIARNCDTIPGMPSSFLRVQGRPRHDMQKFIHALGSL